VVTESLSLLGAGEGLGEGLPLFQPCPSSAHPPPILSPSSAHPPLRCVGGHGAPHSRGRPASAHRGLRRHCPEADLPGPNSLYTYLCIDLNAFTHTHLPPSLSLAWYPSAAAGAARPTDPATPAAAFCSAVLHCARASGPLCRRGAGMRLPLVLPGPPGGPGNLQAAAAGNVLSCLGEAATGAVLTQ
jgi:hypothetical protein